MTNYFNNPLIYAKKETDLPIILKHALPINYMFFFVPNTFLYMEQPTHSVRLKIALLSLLSLLSLHSRTN